MWFGAGASAFLLILAYAVWEWRKRARLLRRLEAQACAGCGHGFGDEAIAEYLGAIGPAELARLDRFQRRFARFRIRCGDCGAVNLVTGDGVPFRASYDGDV